MERYLRDSERASSGLCRQARWDRQRLTGGAWKRSRDRLAKMGHPPSTFIGQEKENRKRGSNHEINYKSLLYHFLVT